MELVPIALLLPAAGTLPDLAAEKSRLLQRFAGCGGKVEEVVSEDPKAEGVVLVRGGNSACVQATERSAQSLRITFGDSCTLDRNVPIAGAAEVYFVLREPTLVLSPKPPATRVACLSIPADANHLRVGERVVEGVLEAEPGGGTTNMTYSVTTALVQHRGERLDRVRFSGTLTLDPTTHARVLDATFLRAYSVLASTGSVNGAAGGGDASLGISNAEVTRLRKGVHELLPSGGTMKVTRDMNEAGAGNAPSDGAATDPPEGKEETVTIEFVQQTPQDGVVILRSPGKASLKRKIPLPKKEGN